MIIWGGWNDQDVLNTGGRYDPDTNSWTATSTTNAPGARFQHTAVWTGSDLIVWGGTDGLEQFNTGGRYDPDTDNWVATSGNAPERRAYHTAAWTGSEMIVWGGINDFGPFLFEHRRQILRAIRANTDCNCNSNCNTAISIVQRPTDHGLG
jgi:N-acetylneuraminic acid mutarotase